MTFATLVNVGLRLICLLISGNVVYLHGFISTHCVWQCVYFFCCPKEVNDIKYYYSTIASFYHIWSIERAKYETVIHFSVPV